MKPQFFTDFKSYCDTITNVTLRMRVLGFETARYSIAQAPGGDLQLQWSCEGL